MSFYDTTATSEVTETKNTFLWHANGDTCTKCRSLDGQRFENQDIFQDTLFSPVWGDILNLNTGELLTHTWCRCNCEVQTEIIITQVPEIEEYQNFLRIMNR